MQAGTTVQYQIYTKVEKEERLRINTTTQTTTCSINQAREMFAIFIKWKH